MFAIAFDRVVREAREHHPEGVSQAYAEIESVLKSHGFVNGRTSPTS